MASLVHNELTHKKTPNILPVQAIYRISCRLGYPEPIQLGQYHNVFYISAVSPEHPTIPQVSTSTPAHTVVPPGRDLLDPSEPVGDLTLTDSSTNISSITALLDCSLPAPDGKQSQHLPQALIT